MGRWIMVHKSLIPCQEQAKLTDYNLVIEKHNQGLEPADVDYECEKLAKFNEAESESLRNIFEDRNKSQQELEKVEKQIQIEINETQNLLRIGSIW